MSEPGEDAAMNAADRPQFDETADLFTAFYAELRRLAHLRLRREGSGQTLQTTALVHEVWLRLGNETGARHWTSSDHFLATVSTSMRHLLVDRARRRRAARHGGECVRVSYEIDEMELAERDDDLLALEEALQALAREDPVKAQLVTLRYFGGLSIEEACDVLELSRTTAHRYWVYSRTWLYRRIRGVGVESRQSESMPSSTTSES
ncbi:MAG: ECF-type sigma factor [Planctomycetaceae bacterium]